MTLEQLFFNSWDSVVRSLTITILAYIAMIVLLRKSGKRTLSKMNAFDFIVTIALGSSLATVALTSSIALVDGILVFFLLIFLQFIVTWLSVRFTFVKKMVTSRPSLLLFKGEIFKEVLKRERITVDEINVAARKKGITSIAEIDVIILETTGDLTVIPKISGEITTLQNVEGKLK